MSSSCQSCISLQKQIRVLKADYEFEIKKIRQDKSTQKAMYEIHLQKQVRKWQEAYQKQKQSKQQQNHNWLVKYDNMISNYTSEMQTLKTNHKDTLQSSIRNLTLQHQHILSCRTKEHQQLIQTMQQNNKRELKQKNQQWETKLSTLQFKNDEYTKGLKKAHELALSELQKKLSSQILGVKSQLKKQEQLHESTKNEAKGIQSSLYQQIFSLKKNNSDTSALLNKETQTNEELRKKIAQIQQEMQKFKQQKQAQLIQKQQQKKLLIDKQKQKFANMLRKQKEQQIQFCQRYESMIVKMQDGRITEKQLYLQNLQDIKSTIQARMSRPEDLLEIQQLKDKLVKKTKELELMVEELKWYRLELENKQQTYNKIFVPLANNSTNNQNVVGKRKQFKLRRQGRSVTTVREILQSMNNNNINSYGSGQSKKAPFLPKSKVL